MTAGRYLAVLSACALILLGVAGEGAYALFHWQHDVVVWCMLGGAAAYMLGVWVVWCRAGALPPAAERRALWLILAAALAARCLLVAAPPVSTDIYRYVWDGRVQAAGINPFRYRPAEPQLQFLRDRAVYPHINRAATAHTIYPPAAQLVFLGVTRLANSVTGMKAAMVAAEMITVAVLLSLLSSRGMPSNRILIYAWNPLPLFEFAGSGHIDAVAIALMLAACWAADRWRPLTAGALLGGAALVKFFPLVIAPALYRRWDWRLPCALIAVVVVLYLPYLSVGWQVLGFLPGYLHDEGLVSGSGFFVLEALDAVVPLAHWVTLAYLASGCALLAGLAWAALERRPASRVSLAAALALLAVFTALVSPHLAWYFTWMLPFLCFKPVWALLYLCAAAPLLYEIIWAPGALSLQAALYIPCALIAALELWIGHGPRTLELKDDGSFRSRHAR